MTNEINATEFLDMIFETREDDEFVLLTKPAGDGWVSAPYDERKLAQWSRGKGSASYYCVSTVRQPEPEADGSLYWRRDRDSLTAAYVVVLDDIGSKIETLPPVEPSYKLESSEGNFQWGYLIEPTEDFARYEAVVEMLGEKGWTDKGAGGSYRVMRVPGSVNVKPGRGLFRSQIVDWHPERVWELDALADALGVNENELDKAARGKARGGVKKSVGGASTFDVDVADPLLAWLEAENLIVKDSGKDVVDVICPWHDKHTTGGDTAGYFPLGRGGDENWRMTRGFKCLHEHCVGKSMKDFRDWAIANGGPFVASVDPIPFLQARYIYIESGRRFADTWRRRGAYPILEFAEFSNRYIQKVEVPGYDKPVNVSTAMLASRDTRRAAIARYIPHQNGDPFVEHYADVDTGEVEYVYNTYLEPNWPETDREPSTFLDHVDYLLPEGDENELFLDWLAWKVQHPAQRSYAMLMIADGAFGTGRSWLLKALNAALQGQVNKASFNQFIGRGTSGEQNYNDWAAECQFLIVEEAKDVISDDYYRIYETLKDRVSNDPTEFWRNSKYGGARFDWMWFNALIFSNHNDALVLPENDRRVCVLTNPKEMEQPEYYDRLHASIDDEAAAIYWFLKRRDVSKFDHVYPPMTPGKLQMIESTASPYDRIYDWLVENADGDLVTQKVLGPLVRRAARTLNVDDTVQGEAVKRAVRAIWKRLPNLRGVKNGARYMIDGEREEVRALRNTTAWKRADEIRSDVAIIDELTKNDHGNVVKFPNVPTSPQKVAEE